MRSSRIWPGITALAVVAVLAIVIFGLDHGSSPSSKANNASSPLVSNSASPSAAPSSPAATSVNPEPTWLPPGVTREIDKNLDAGDEFTYFNLPGAANQDPTAHGAPPVKLSLHSIPWPDATLPDPGDTLAFTVSTVDVAGNQGRLLVPNTGYGPYRIDWISGGRLYTLLVSRFKTPAGASGFDAETLLRIARSIPSPSATSSPSPAG